MRASRASYSCPPELLAPAGDEECLRAAVENGADAVYFGLERFNARMRAKNFTQADLPDKCSALSLVKVGTVLLEWMQQLK